MTDSSRNVVVLVGNGLSVAFNGNLNLRAITQEMVKRIENATDDGSKVVDTMKKIAERALPEGAVSDDDFEVLVGAFGAQDRTLSYLRDLAKVVSPEDDGLGGAVQRVSSFVQQIRDTGLSYVLEVILEHSRPSFEEASELHEFANAILRAFEGRVTLGNLNYDTLLLSALLAVCPTSDMCDMGHGWKRVSLISTEGDQKVEVPALRKLSSDFPDKRVTLLHLHGSLTYWSDIDQTVFAKLSLEQLDSSQQWEAVRDQETKLRPVVILANQRDKSAQATEYPFSLAYEVFRNKLKMSSHWLIVGYSFRDDCVNQELRFEFAERAEKPKVLVVTYGEDPSEHAVERAFGWGAEDGSSSSWLTINREGAFAMKESSDWKSFSEA